MKSVQLTRCQRQDSYHLQPGAVNHLVVNGKLMTTVVDDENTNAAAAIVEVVAESVQKVALVKDTQTLLDVTGLGHGNNAAVVTDIQNAVLLEDRATHVLDDHRR
jgi:malate synthase